VVVMPRRWWLRWIVWGLVGCVADVIVLGGGMGVAVGVPAVGLALGLWAAWLAWRHADSRDQVLLLSLWGGIVSAGVAAHFVFVSELGLLLLLGPEEASRSILDEGLGFLQGVVPPTLDSIGAFWILQTMAFGGLELLLGVAGAWAGARLLLARDARLARWIERAWDRLPRGLEAGFVVGTVAAVLGGPVLLVSAGVPLAHLLLAAPLGGLAAWLTQRWTGEPQTARGQLTLAGLLAGVLVASSVVGLHIFFTLAAPGGHTTLSAAYAHLGDVSLIIPRWMDPLWVGFPLLSVLFVMITAGLAVGGSRGVSRWIVGALEN